MELSFKYVFNRKYYVLNFGAGKFETAPFVRELRFWGVDRFPCPHMTTLAALIALKNHDVKTVTLSNVELNPPVCSALLQHFGVEVHPAQYDVNKRDLAGGDSIIAPVRFGTTVAPQDLIDRIEVLTWMSLDDVNGPFGGQIRTNIDIFDLTESEKNLIVALCCAGNQVGHIVATEPEPALAHVFHRVGLELISPPNAA